MLSQLNIISAAVLISSALLLANASPTLVNHSPISIPLARRLNFTGGTLFEKDKARVHYLKQRTSLSSDSKFLPVDPAVTNAAVSYLAQVSIGTPPQTYSLIVDTGSSNTWIGAGKSYTSESGKYANNLMEVVYGSGFFFGLEYTDILTFGVTIPGQAFGIAEISEGFSGVDGILGLGPTDLTSGTISNGSTVPTVLDNAASLGLIPANILGVSFEPLTSIDEANGAISLGGPDTSLYTGSLGYVPFTSTSPASEYVGIDQTVTYAGQTLLSSAGIVDTGTTLTMLASDAFSSYISLTGATLDEATDLYKLSSSQFDALQSLVFNIGGTEYEFTPNAQIWPRSLNSAIGGSAGSIYLIVGNLGSPSGEGLDFINGMTWLERFYFVYDASNSRVGFATTSFTDATSN